MSHDPNDPRLTAYALGELEEAELPEVYRLLAESPECRRSVEETRSLAKTLTEQLRAESGPGLSDSHWRAIEERLPPLPEASASGSSTSPVLAFSKFKTVGEEIVGSEDASVFRIGYDQGRGSRWPRALRFGGLATAAALLIAFGLFMTQTTERHGGDSNVALNEEVEVLGIRDRPQVEPKSAAPLDFEGVVKTEEAASRVALAELPPTSGAMNARENLKQNYVENRQPPGSEPKAMDFLRDGGDGPGGEPRTFRGRVSGFDVEKPGEPQPGNPRYQYAQSGQSAAKGMASGPGSPTLPADPAPAAAANRPSSNAGPFGGARGSGRTSGGIGGMAGGTPITGPAPAPSRAPAPSPPPVLSRSFDLPTTPQRRSDQERMFETGQSKRLADEDRGGNAPKELGALREASESDVSESLNETTREKKSANRLAAAIVAPPAPMSMAPGAVASTPSPSPASPAAAPALDSAPKPSFSEDFAEAAGNLAKAKGDAVVADNQKPEGRSGEGAKSEVANMKQGKSVRADLARAEPEALDRTQGLKNDEVVKLEVAPEAEARLKVLSPENAPAIGTGLVPANAAEAYAPIAENEFKLAQTHQRDTFSIDVDTASYANVRRFLNQNTMPPPDAVRVEELVNYFSYNDLEPSNADRFSVNLESARCPWNAGNRLVRINLQAKRMRPEQRPSSNLVFLLDVSGSMQDPNKLPFVKAAMGMLLDRLGERDRVAIVTYSDQARIALASTPANQREAIRGVIEGLRAEGSTNGSSGLHKAYETAVGSFIPGGVNRIVLCSDGDFNVDVTSDNDLVRLIEERARSGVYLSVFGFGMGNLKDSKLEAIADKGNGHYGYIDTLNEARKAFVTEAESTLAVVAKDVKIQVEFNPAKVASYRLLGYENRALRNRDFRDDSKDAGELGAGHAVTAFYEITPMNPQLFAKMQIPANDPLRYGVQASKAPSSTMDPSRPASGGREGKPGDSTPPAPAPASAPAAPAGQPSLAAATDHPTKFRAKTAEAKGQTDLLTVRLRSQPPEGGPSQEIERSLVDDGKDYASASEDFRFGSSVAAFGMLLRDSRFRGNITYDAVLELAKSAQGSDPFGYRKEFLDLAAKAKELDQRRQGTAPFRPPLAAPGPAR